MKKTSKLLSALLVVSQVFGYTPAVFANEEPTSPTLSSESATVQEGSTGGQTEETVDSTPETTPEAPPTDSSTEEQPTTPEQPVEPETPTVPDSSKPETTPVEPEKNQKKISLWKSLSQRILQRHKHHKNQQKRRRISQMCPLNLVFLLIQKQAQQIKE